MGVLATTLSCAPTLVAQTAGNIAESARSIGFEADRATAVFDEAEMSRAARSPRSPFARLFSDGVSDGGQLPSRENAVLLVQGSKHCSSDGAFGATLGIVTGRTVTTGRGRAAFALQPMVVPRGGGVTLTKFH